MKINLNTFEACSSNEEKFQFLKSIDFGTMIKEKNGIYYSFIPTLSISAEGASVDDCYTQLRTKKEEHFKRLIDTDSSEDILFSNHHFFLKGEWAQLKLKTLRYGIAAAFLIFAVFFIGWQVDAMVKRSLLSASQFVNNEMVKIKSEVSPQSKEERLLKFKTKLIEIKPYTDALNEILFSQNRKRNEGKSNKL